MNLQIPYSGYFAQYKQLFESHTAPYLCIDFSFYNIFTG